jgi:cytoskeleton protein RodZ
VPLLLSAVVLIAAGGYLWWTGSQVDPDRSGSFGNGSDQDVVDTEPADAEQPDDESLTQPTSAARTGRSTDAGASESSTSIPEQTATDGDRIGTLGAADSTVSSDNATVDTGSNTGSNVDNASTLPSSDVALLPYPSFPAGLDIASEDAPATETVAEDTPEANEVVVSFDGPCWVDIRDAAGEVQLFGEMASGDSHVLGGEPPYSLVIGNASAVSMTVGGAPFDVRAIAKGNVARFELDPAEIVAAPASNGPAASPSDN